MTRAKWRCFQPRRFSQKRDTWQSEAASFIGPAREEFLAEVAYYRHIQADLGPRFVAAIENAAARALAFPFAGTPVTRGTRRVTVKNFPFSLIYRPTTDGIVIIAVAHQSKRPGYWRGRPQGE